MDQEQVWGGDDVPAEEEPPAGRPLLATLIGAICLLASVASPVRDVAPADVPGAAFRAGQIAGGAFIGVIVWGIAYAITIRRASNGWKAGSLVLLAILGLLTSVARIGGREAALRDDARGAAARMQQAVAGGVPIDAALAAGSGPLSQMMAAMLNAALADQQAYNRSIEASGVYRIIDLTTISRDEPALRSCDRIDGLALAARGQAGRFDAHLGAARAAAAPHIQSGALRLDEMESFIAGAANNEASYRRNWALTGDWASESAALCRLLGTRRWTRRGDEILFASEADAAAANGHLARINALAAEQARLQEQARATSRRRLDELKL